MTSLRCSLSVITLTFSLLTSPSIFANCFSGECQVPEEIYSEADFCGQVDDCSVCDAPPEAPPPPAPCTFRISGDVRAEWQSVVEKINNEHFRGHGAKDCSGRLTSLNHFDTEFNLNFEYKCERSWAYANLRFDNQMGVQQTRKTITEPSSDANAKPGCQLHDINNLFGSGDCDGLCLKKAYMGYNICSDDCTRLDIEIGRRRIYDVFDSRIQFGARFDGIVFRYATKMFCQDFYWNLGGFVADYNVNHYPWVTEFGFLNICESGLDLKYSYIDWRNRGPNRGDKRDAIGSRYQNSQFTLQYNFNPEILTVPAKFYAAYLVNTAASPQVYTNDTHANEGFYVGCIIGQVLGEGDWSFDTNYQWVEAQAVPDPDINGIGRGNVRRSTITQNSSADDASLARGNGNYKGWKFEALYGWTDSIQIDVLFQFSKAIDENIGGDLNYNKFRIQVVYAF